MKCRKPFLQEAVNGVTVTVNTGAAAILGLVAAGEGYKYCTTESTS